MRREILKMAIVSTLYVATGKLGFLMAIPPGNVTVVWPPSGIAWAALLLGGFRLWPAIWLGSFLVNFLFFLEVPSFSWVVVLTSSGIATGSTLQALIGAWLIRRFSPSGDFLNRIQGILQFAWIGPLGCLVAASMGVAALCLAGLVSWGLFPYTWLTWWLGDLMGVFIVTPVVLSWARPIGPPWTPRRLCELLGFLGLVLGVAHLIFGGGSFLASHHYPIMFMLVPFLIWAAVRFGPAGVMSAILMTSGLALLGTIGGSGPFVWVTLNESLLLLQAFLGVHTISGLLLAAAITERREAEEHLRDARDKLQRRVEERTVQLEQTGRALQGAQGRLIQAEKLETMGRLAAGIAHEVKNPLAAVLLGVNYLSRHLPQGVDHAQQVLHDMAEAVKKADQIVKGMLDFSAPTKLEMTRSDLNTVIEKALSSIRQKSDQRHVALVCELRADLPQLLLDQQKMEQVFANLLTNALDAMPKGGRLCVRTSVKQFTEHESSRDRWDVDPFQAGEKVILAEVEDTGRGIEEKDLPKLFEPFFTTKPTGKGVGLGLAVTKTIVALHRGAIDIQNRPGGGVRVALLLRT